MSRSERPYSCTHAHYILLRLKSLTAEKNPMTRDWRISIRIEGSVLFSTWLGLPVVARRRPPLVFASVLKSPWRVWNKRRKDVDDSQSCNNLITKWLLSNLELEIILWIYMKKVLKLYCKLCEKSCAKFLGDLAIYRSLAICVVSWLQISFLTSWHCW
jgi:hypothetical protein